MNEDALVQMLAKLSRDFDTGASQSPAAVNTLKEKVTAALFQNQEVSSTGHHFLFEKMELPVSEKEKNETLLAAQKFIDSPSPAGTTDTYRIFRREVPFISSQLKGSAPEWARGAAVSQTIGPIMNPHGIPSWFDIYKVEKGVKVYLQGATQPALIVSVKVPWLSPINQQTNKYTIPESSIWLNAALFTTQAPDNQYTGLKVKTGTISFAQNITLSNDTIIVQPGNQVTVDLTLLPQEATGEAPGDIGIDAKTATVNLPQQFSFLFSHSGFQVLEAGDAQWKLFGQENKFSQDKNQAPFYLSAFNRVAIPYKTDVSQQEILSEQSKVVSIKGTAGIIQSAWSFSCALLDINNPLEAYGAGAMLVQLKQGLEISWQGLRDINLKNESTIFLRGPWLLAEPGRISLTDLDAAGNLSHQSFNLWKNKNDVWNTIDLSFTDHVTVFYNCLQDGNESIMAIADCTGAIGKPVDVAGKPFALESKKTFFVLSFTKDKNFALLYDDNLLADNNPVPNTPVLFRPTSIGLNNALLKVSPIAGFMLFAELQSIDTCKKAVLVYSFGLVYYLPTLPDPYASNLGMPRSRYTRDQPGMELYVPVESIHQLLVAFLPWEGTDEPVVSFSWGNIWDNNSVLSSPVSSEPVSHPMSSTTENKPMFSYQRKAPSFKMADSRAAAIAQARALDTRQQTLQQTQYNNAGYDADTYTRMQQNQSAVIVDTPRVEQQSLFNLLDVSTHADLLGVSFGFINERIIFNDKYQIADVPANDNPLAIEGMDVVATSRFVRLFTVPQISWEPLINIPAPDINFPPTPWDPPLGILKFDNDGSPTLIGNTGLSPVPIAPIPATKSLVENYAADKNYKAWSLFTLPNGMNAIGRYDQENYYLPKPNTKGAKIELLKAAFDNDTQAGWQIITRAGINPQEDNTIFEGGTNQPANVHHIFINGTWSILGKTPTTIFNNEFSGIKTRGIPLERYDFTGYGAQVFSKWLNKNAEIAQVSQAFFDVWRGRVAKEVIQVRSIIYPWGIRVVRTITMHRASTGFEYRVDSGWRADSDGVYNFYTSNEPTVNYSFHPGIVKGVYDVENIVENDLAPLKTTWFKNYGVYVDNDTGEAVNVGAGVNLEVEMVPVYFDANVLMTDIDGTAKDNNGVPKGGFVPSKKMVGYLQVAPRGIIVSPEIFANVLDLQGGLGGPVDCTINIHGSGQKMRISEVEVNHSKDSSNKIVFVTAANGMPVLPKDGSWSLAKHQKSTKEVLPVTETAISLIRQGLLINGTVPDQSHPKEITAIAELFKLPEDREIQFAFLQNTDAQKILFRNPFFKMGENLLHSTLPDLGDAYKLLNSKGIFPLIDGLEKIDLDAAGCATKIIEEGYQMVDKLATNTTKMLEQAFPTNASFTFINEPGLLKVYVEYTATDKNGNVDSPGILNVDINSQVNNWVNKLNDVTMVVDLLGMKRLFMIVGKFDTAKGEAPEFKGPKLIPGNDLKPIIDILEILESIGTNPDYADLVKKGLEIFMSNSPTNWEYKFKAEKEIPLIQFPPAYLDGPTTPLRLSANMKLGVYFNLGMELPPTTGLPTLSAGAYVEFGAELHVMCVSLAAATIYAVGQVDLKISGDTIKGPGLYMKLGFGVELMVGIPVVGNVSVYYGVAIEVSADTTQITVAAMIIFRGRAEIFGGIVTIQIQIEASGKIHKENERTDCIAQVSFRIDVSIVFVINFHETETWQETRQIA